MNAGEIFVAFVIPAVVIAVADAAMRANAHAVRRGRQHPGA